MSKKLEKYRAERDRNNAKIAELKEENRELDRLITELENTEIIGLVRAENMRPDELAEFLNALRQPASKEEDEHEKEC